LLYRLDRSKATDVYRNLGRNYGPALVRPTARGCVRSAFTQFPVTAAASTASGAIQDSIASCVKDKLESVGLQLQAFQLRSVALDPNVQTAVTAKVAAQQKLEQQAFDEATAQKLADILRIQAQATRDQVQIVQCGGHPGTETVNGASVTTIVPNQCAGAGLTDAYLRLAYIQALQAIATSGKASTIIVPAGQAPLISVPSGSGSTTP